MRDSMFQVKWALSELVAPELGEFFRDKDVIERSDKSRKHSFGKWQPVRSHLSKKLDLRRDEIYLLNCEL
jgi:hypothetical protein